MRKVGCVVGIELRKAFGSKKFLLGMALLLIFSILSAVYMIESRAGYNPGGVLEGMKDGEYTYNPMLPLITFYNSWVGGDELSLAAAAWQKILCKRYSTKSRMALRKQGGIWRTIPWRPYARERAAVCAPQA